MRSRLIALMGFLLALSLVVPLSAYAAPIEVDVTVNIEPIFVLQVVGPGLSSPLTLMAWTPTADDFNAQAYQNIKYPGGTPVLYTGGWTLDGLVATCLIKANTPWHLYVRGGTAFFSGGGGAKPVGDMVWIDGGQPYRHLTPTNEPVYVAARHPGSYDLGGGGTDPYFAIGITFHVLLDWANDTPGVYTNTVIFTLSG